MVIRFITTIEEKLSQIPIKDGQIISIQDKNMWCYDMFNTRHTISDNNLNIESLILDHDKVTNVLNLKYNGETLSSIPLESLSGVSDVVTTDENGLMISEDKQKLDLFGQGYVVAGQKQNTTLGERCTAEGLNSTASGKASHAEGCSTLASGTYSHAENNGTSASGNYSHAQGVFTIASGIGAHAEGTSTTASGEYSHAEGTSTFAEGQNSHAEGTSSKASANYSHAQGDNTIAYGQSMTTLGMYNVTKSVDNIVSDLMIIGNGGPSVRSNAFRVDKDGATYGKSEFNGSGADYAEYFEMEDGNNDNEDLRGYFVTFGSGDKIKKAKSTDSYILGVISANPVIIGNSDPDDWHNKYLRDEFGCYIKETITNETKIGVDEHGNEIVKQTKHESYILNPDFDESKTDSYIPRKKRPEWQPVGLLGQLIVRDNGTCQLGRYCTVTDEGVATHSDVPGWRVIGRINENLIKIMFK